MSGNVLNCGEYRGVFWFLSLGKRFSDKSVIALMQRWEFLEKRNCLVDGITILRMVAASAPNDDDLKYTLHHLFLQQRAAMRTTLTSNPKNEMCASNVAKAVLVRRNLFIHLKNTFPKCLDAIEPYASFEFYNTYKGVDINGVRAKADDDYEDDDDEGADDADAPLSVQQSRKMLIKLCDSLSKNRYERPLIKMSKEHFAPNCVDLTTVSAKGILTTIRDIKAHYDVDFAVADAAPSVVVHAADGDGGQHVRVQVVADALDEAAYKDRLMAWEQSVVKYEEEKCNEYLKQHVLGYVVDNLDDPTRVGAKVKKLADACGVGKGVKRKLFLHDDLCEKGVDWTTAT